MSSTMQVQTAGGPGLEERRMDDQLMVDIAAGSQAKCIIMVIIK